MTVYSPTLFAAARPSSAADRVRQPQSRNAPDDCRPDNRNRLTYENSRWGRFGRRSLDHSPDFLGNRHSVPSELRQRLRLPVRSPRPSQSEKQNSLGAPEVLAAGKPDPFRQCVRLSLER